MTVPWQAAVNLGVLAAMLALAPLAASLILWLNERTTPRTRILAPVSDDLTILAYICDPCHGQPGRCICDRKCAHPLCGAADTTVSDDQFRRELAELLKQDGGGDG
jgi:hypothetical protein